MSKADTPKWSARQPVLVGGLAIFLLFGGFGVWATHVQISGAVVASGQIEVERNRQIVQHPTGGVVTEINIREGSHVEKDDVLLRLDDAQRASELAIFTTNLFEMRARTARLQAELKGADSVEFDAKLTADGLDDAALADMLRGQRMLFAARVETLARQANYRQKQSDQIAAQLQGIDAVTIAQSRQLDLITAELSDHQGLYERGLVQIGELRSLQREKVRLVGALAQLTATKSEANERLLEIELAAQARAAELAEDTARRYRELLQQQSMIAEKRRTLMREIEGYNIRAPVSGVVYGLNVSTLREVVRAADPLLYLIPQDRPLIVMVKIAPKDVAQVRVGQEVDLRVTAFDQKSTAVLTGKVQYISADVLNDAPKSAAHFRIEIHLSDAEQRLLPGMPVDAYIRTTDRTPLAYLIQPLKDYFVRAFRES